MCRPARATLRIRLPLPAVAATLLVFQAGPAAADRALGQLLIIGGGTRPPSIMQLFARLAGGAAGKVLVLPQASERPEAGAEIATELQALGIGTVTIVGVDRAGADSDGTLALAAHATGVYVGGGDQTRLMAVLHGTRLEAALRALYRDGAVMAGTSAGAAVMSRLMITGDETRPLSKDDNWQTIEAGNVATGEGLGFLDEAVVDQHFVRRRRHNRLIAVVLEHPALVGIGIDESTALWVKPDRTFEVVGDGPAVVIDAGAAAIARDAEGFGLRGSGLRLHVLRAGARYDLAARAVLALGP